MLKTYLKSLNHIEVAARIQCFGIKDLLAMQPKPLMTHRLYLMNVAKFIQKTINDSYSNIKEVEFSKHLSSLILAWINRNHYQMIML